MYRGLYQVKVLGFFPQLINKKETKDDNQYIPPFVNQVTIATGSRYGAKHLYVYKTDRQTMGDVKRQTITNTLSECSEAILIYIAYEVSNLLHKELKLVSIPYFF